MWDDVFAAFRGDRQGRQSGDIVPIWIGELTFGSWSGIQNSRFQERDFVRFYGNHKEETVHS